MNKTIKTIGIIGVVTFLSGGLGRYVAAQAPTLSLPPLPGAPSAPSAPALSQPSNSSAPTASGAPQPNDGSSQSVTVASATQVPASTASSAIPPLPNEAIDKAPATSTGSGAIAVANAAPNFKDANAGLPALDANPAVMPPLPMPASMTPPVVPTPLPAIGVIQAPIVVAKKAPEKTWLTKLAPSIIPPRLGYHYRRELLPSEIYRTQYDIANRHLPSRVTRDDYTQLFLVSVARNDINATRALLNEGVPATSTNAKGETALALAQRYHAGDTARLLMAHGAQ